MEQLIFIGVIVLFSILEAVGRKKKAEGGEAGELPPPPPTTPRRRAPQAPQGRVPGPMSYDDDPSFDERAAGAGAPRNGSDSSSSEGLIPADVWEEIAALARGGVPPSRAPAPQGPQRPAPEPSRPVPTAKPVPAPTPVPAPSPRVPRPSAPTRGRRAEAGKVGRPAPRPPAPIRGRKAVTPAPALELALEETREEHPLHATHPEMGGPVRDRVTAYAADARARVRSEVTEVRRVLRSGNAGSLRKAVMLSEILGPPAALRDGG